MLAISHSSKNCSEKKTPVTMLYSHCPGPAENRGGHDSKDALSRDPAPCSLTGPDNWSSPPIEVAAFLLQPQRVKPHIIAQNLITNASDDKASSVHHTTHSLRGSVGADNSIRRMQGHSEAAYIVLGTLPCKASRGARASRSDRAGGGDPCLLMNPLRRQNT